MKEINTNEIIKKYLEDLLADGDTESYWDIDTDCLEDDILEDAGISFKGNEKWLNNEFKKAVKLFNKKTKKYFAQLAKAEKELLS